MKKEAWIVTLDEVFYYKNFLHGGKDSGWEFTPYIECAYQFPTEAAAKATLEGLTSGGDFKDSRGHVTPTTSFGMRKMTRKDYNEIKKRKETKTYFRTNEVLNTSEEMVA